MGRLPRIVAITTGDPFDRLTRSGTNYHLFSALQRAGILAGAVNARPNGVAKIERIGAWSRDPEYRRQSSDAAATRTSPVVRRIMSFIATQDVLRIEPSPDVLLQIGAWYDLGRSTRLGPRLRVSYHDSNLAAFLARNDLILDRESPAIRRALAWERRVYERLDLVLPRSEWLRRHFIEDFGIDPDKVVAVGAGANLEQVPEVPARSFTPLRVLFVGKDFDRKGGLQLLRAFTALRSERPDAELWIVGPRKLLPQLPGVRYFGRLQRDSPDGENKLMQLYREATLFVHPSVFEPWGSVLLEAMAWGLPCIAGRVCALPEIVNEDVTGCLVEPGSTNDLLEKLRYLSNSPNRARAFGMAGRRRFLERFTWEAVVNRIIGEVVQRLDDGHR